MNPSTEGVLVPSAIIFDLLKQYDHLRTAAKPIFDLAADLDPNARAALVSIELFNEICRWIESHFGAASIREAGRNLGKTTYDQMLQGGKLGLSPSPNRIFEELRRLEAVNNRDPHRRGWEILESGDQKVRLRFTQTSNCMLMEGLLLTLLERTGAVLPRVNHMKCTRAGADYCEYEALWLKARARPISRPTVGSPLKAG